MCVYGYGFSFRDEAIEAIRGSKEFTMLGVDFRVYFVYQHQRKYFLIYLMGIYLSVLFHDSRTISREKKDSRTKFIYKS